jgi:hypothetical protein
MDTRFWGPSGWRLLHLITMAAADLDPKALDTVFRNLPYVLPCKFCRASLTDYYAMDPIPTHPHDFPKWLYRIHNRVNGKLREQKLITTPDPIWQNIKQHYTQLYEAQCTKGGMIGWDFLFSVAFTTPCPQVQSAPMPGTPPIAVLNTPELRNRWGVISRSERIPYIEAWWRSIPKVLPIYEWRQAWSNVVKDPPSLRSGRTAITAWLYKAEAAICKELKETQPHNSFKGLCKELQTFTSGCGKTRSLKVKTCRSKTSHIRKTFKKHRNTKYFATGGFL